MNVSFYLIRHGKTVLNQQHQVQGWCDSPLIDEGVEAARAAGRKLAGGEFVRAIASDKGRTCQTLAELLDARDEARGQTPSAPLPKAPDASPSTQGAARYLETLGQALAANEPRSANGLPLLTDWRLREWCYGDLEMRSGDELHRRLTEGFGKELTFAQENEHLPETADNLARLDRSGRAERFADIEARVRSFLKEAGDATLAAGGGNVLAVTHAFTIRTIMYLYDRARINEPLRILNGSITRVDYDGKSFVLRYAGAPEPLG